MLIYSGFQNKGNLISYLQVVHKRIFTRVIVEVLYVHEMIETHEDEKKILHPKDSTLIKNRVLLSQDLIVLYDFIH